MPGDVINAEVYAKYADTNSSNWTGALSTLMSQIAASTAGVVVDGASYSSSTSSFPAGFGTLQSTNNNGAPRSYLNWLIFDRNYGYLTGGFKQITTAARETGTDVAHERIFNTSPVQITQPGYVYIYLSNESTSLVEVFFDDFKVTHTKSPVIQTDDYYPFGLAFNSHSRENSTPNNYLYNGKEKQDELGLDWLDYGARMYMSDIGRWGVVDPLSEKYWRWSQYNYTLNNPVKFIDPDGRSVYYNGRGKRIGTDIDGDDGKMTFVTSNKEARNLKKDIKQALKVGQREGTLINANQVRSGVTLSRQSGRGILSSVSQQSHDSAPGANDANTREVGGHTQVNPDGTETNVAWRDGPVRIGNNAGSIDLFNGVGRPPLNSVSAYWHLHTSKKIEFVDADGQTKTARGSNTPSVGTPKKPGDILVQRGLEQQGYQGQAIQVGTYSGVVNFYNGQGVTSSVRLGGFTNAVNDEQAEP